jgi:PAS domain S-box-containing protein
MIAIQQVKRIILLVKESPVKRELYRHYLQQEASSIYDVWEAESGEVSLHLCASQVPDCIVLDYLLPDRNGLDFLHELKTYTAPTLPPVIMINERGNETIAIRAFKMGVQDYLIESEITAENFLSVTRTALDNFRLRQQLRESEARYRAIVEDQSELICRFLPNCTLTFVNKAYGRYFDSTPEQLIGQNFLDLIPESYHNCVRQEMTELSAATPENAVRTLEHPVIKPDGEIGWQQWTNRVIFNRNGELIELQAVGRDISDRKQTEIALQKANERFELAAAVNCLIYDFDLQQNTIYRSQGIRKLFGYLPGEIEATAEWWYERVHPQQRETIKETIGAILLGTETSICLEYQVRHRDGHYIWVQDMAIIVRDESGRAVQIVGRTTDISDRKLTEQLLRESEERLKLAIATAKLGYWQLNLTTYELFSSDQCKANFGLPPEENLSYQRLFEIIHPDDRNRVQGLVTFAIENHRNYQAEYRNIWSDGSIHWIAVCGNCFYDANDRPLRMVGVATDITERKLSEVIVQHQLAQIEAIYATAPIGLCFIDREGRYAQINERLAEINGLSVSEHLGRTVREILPELADLQEQIFEQIFQTRLPILDVEVQGTTPAQPEVERHWLASYYPLTDKDGQVIGINITVLEMTERKQAEAERDRLLAEAQATREAAEQANRDKDEFVAVIAHELRSPINSVAGWMQLLRTRQFDRATINRAYDAIERGTQTQVQLIEDLLDISRIACGTLRLNFAPVNLTLVLQAAISLMRPMADARQIELETQLDETAPVYGDIKRLQQVWVNLLTNAIKFTPERGRVTITLELDEEQAKIIVSDTGQGISAEFLPNIFEQFQQAQKNSGSKAGLGLGLAIVKNLVELHDGTIVAESPGLGEGATFTVWLPLLESEVVTIPQETSIAIDASALAGIRILAVDDEPDSLQLLQFILESAGAEVQTASSGSAALEIFSQFNPNFLVSDIAMPDLNGHQLLQQIRAEHPEREILAIALTAYASSSDREYALRIGFERYFSKPIEPAVLVQAIVSLAFSS